MSNKIYKIILAVSVVLIVVASVNIFILAREYRAGINEYRDLEQYVEVVEETESTSQADEGEQAEQQETKESVIPVSLEIDFDQLKEINGDLVGWLYYEPLDISYPIVRGDDNDYYTHYTFENEKNSSGAIFMDFLNKPNMDNYNTIIYGHNMRNGTMFGSLKKLLNDDSIIEEDPYFYIFTEDQAFMYEIASVYITTSESDTYNLIETQEDQQDYINYILEVSTWLWDKEITSSDKIVTLSTCHGLHSTNRTVVHGVLIASEDR
ncbi:MAG: class B sortase [Bacillota bacterium]|nr:class B sortase [Bacillota bacterium]